MRSVVQRQLRVLKTLLPNATLSASLSQEPYDLARDGARDVFGVVADMFDLHPVLTSVQFIAKASDALEDQSGDDGKVATRGTKVTPVYAFRIDVVDSHVDIDDIWGHVELLAAFGSLKRADRYPESLLEELHEKCRQVLKDFEEVRAFCEAPHEFWRRASRLTVTREQWDASMLCGVVDVDALRDRVFGWQTGVIERQTDLTRSPAFWNAATLESIPLRLAAGMNPHACDGEGLSALVAASAMKNVALVDKLLDAGADPDRVDGTGFNATTAALAVNDTNLFARLVRAGANPNGPEMLPAVLVALHTPHPVGTLAAALDAGADSRVVLQDGSRFDHAIEALVTGSPPTLDALIALARSRTTELEVQETFGDQNVASHGKKSKSALAL